MNYFAICTMCKNSVHLKQWQTGRYSCPLCGEDYGTQPQNKAGFLVDSALSNQAYNIGQEYFNNSDFAEATKYFEKAISFNSNHYLAVYFLHMCKIYESEVSVDFDIVGSVANALQQSVNAIIRARVDVVKRLSFVTLIYNQCYILISKYYGRIVQELTDLGDWTILRKKSLEVAMSIKKIVDIDKETIMAQNPAMLRNLVAIADIGITACQTVVFPKISQVKSIEHELNVPDRLQHHRARALCAAFVTYAQSLDRSFSYSTRTDYGAVLAYNDKFVLPCRRKYYFHNAPFLSKYVSQRPDLFGRLVDASTFVADYAHHICFGGLFKEKTVYYEQLIYESVDNCLDSLMPRIVIMGKDNIKIHLLPFKEQCRVADILNDFLGELYRLNREYAIKKVYCFFRYTYEGIKQNYDKLKKRYFRVASKIKDDKAYTQEMKNHMSLLYQVSASCVLTALVSDIDKNTVANARDKMLQLALDACVEFDSMNVEIKKLKELEHFVDFKDIYKIIKQACGEKDEEVEPRVQSQKGVDKKVV